MNREEFIEKYWKDPVWSKVISFIIIGIGTSLLTTIYIWIKSIYEGITFRERFERVVTYLKADIEINTFFFWLLIAILIVFIVSYLILIYKKIEKSLTKPEADSNEDEDELPRTGMTSTAIFSEKLAGAFSGQRGFKWYESKEAIMRLEKFFEPPLQYEVVGKGGILTPIWWFRAGSSMYIDKFKKLSRTKLLIGIREFKIKREARGMGYCGLCSEDLEGEILINPIF